MPTMEMKAMAIMALGIWALCLLVCCLTAMPGTGTHLMRSIRIPVGLVISLQSIFSSPASESQFSSVAHNLVGYASKVYKSV